jgi:hypothetical protein
MREKSEDVYIAEVLSKSSSNKNRNLSYAFFFCGSTILAQEIAPDVCLLFVIVIVVG